MVERIITDNAAEVIEVRWDGTRFALIKERKDPQSGLATSTDIIILNPREMLDIIQFASNLGGK